MELPIAGFADQAVSTSLKPDARKFYKRSTLDSWDERSLRFRERRCLPLERISRCRNQSAIAPR
jgi:hypothetical protein